jgi:hypothetical protein
MFEGAQEFQELPAVQLEKCADFLAVHCNLLGSAFEVQCSRIRRRKLEH